MEGDTGRDPGQWRAPDQWGAPPAAPPAYGYPYYAPAAPRTSGQAVAALVLAIGSFAVCPVAPAVVALFLAAGAKREIRASGGAVQGESMANAAKVVAIVHLALAAVVIAFLVLLVVVGIASSRSTG